MEHDSHSLQCLVRSGMTIWEGRGERGGRGREGEGGGGRESERKKKGRERRKRVRRMRKRRSKSQTEGGEEEKESKILLNFTTKEYKTHFTSRTEGICDWPLKCLISLLGYVHDSQWIAIFANLTYLVISWISMRESPVV